MKKLRIILCIAFAIFVIPYIVSGLSWYILGERIYGAIFLILSIPMLLINFAMIFVNIHLNKTKK